MSRAAEFEGMILDVRGNNQYLVEVAFEGKTKTIVCYLSGKMRQNRISILVGDKVKVEMPPPYSAGRITYREK